MQRSVRDRTARRRRYGLSGVLPHRPDDVTGIGATWIAMSAADSVVTRELVVEVFHRLSLTPAISVIPDIQLVNQYAGTGASSPRAVFTVRMRIEL